MTPQARLAGLDSLLTATHGLWHPQPFREHRPAWCETYPALSASLLALSDDEAAYLSADRSAALGFLQAFLPRLAECADYMALPSASQRRLPVLRARWASGIPGRKQAQIEALSAAIVPANHELIDWCGGKGYLARHLALSHDVAVHTLEIDPALVQGGRKAAQRFPQAQVRFSQCDVIAEKLHLGEQAHIVALHACGDLHRQLLQQALGQSARAIDLAPCCYYRHAPVAYASLSGQAELSLTPEDLRLAVTETVTAAPRQTRQRQRETAWKLAFDHWRRLQKGGAYRPFKPLPASWKRASFAEFMQQLCAREGVPLPASGHLAELERAGWRRLGEVERLRLRTIKRRLLTF